jgi:hypothetical protein
MDSDSGDSTSERFYF